MSAEHRQRGLAAITDIRRRLDQRIAGPADDTDDTDDTDVEVLEIIARQKKRLYDLDHPVMRRLPQRRDIDG